MTEEAVVVVCPNPRCQREIGEPILLTILSVTPPKQYKACPHCFAKLEQEAPVEQKEVPEPQVEQEEAIETEEEEKTADNLAVNTVLEKVKDSGPRFLKKVKALIPSTSGLKKEKKEKTKEPEAESTFTKEETAKEAPKTRPPAEKGEGSSGCPQSFGYLANRPPDAPIPQECLVCPKIVECMLKVEE